MDLSLTALAKFVTAGIVPLLAAGVGAYMGAYLKKKGERLATSEDFRRVLQEQIETTFETERVKSAIASAAATSLETIKTDLQQRLSSATFWRERAVRMKDIVFEAAIALDTLLENCLSVPWLTKTSLEEIHDRGHSAIARIHYAGAQLREMQVLDDKRAAAIFVIGGGFHDLAGAVAVYKDELASGNLGPNGPANDAATKVAISLLDKAAAWRTELQDLRKLVAWLAIAPDPLLAQRAPATHSHNTITS